MNDNDAMAKSEDYDIYLCSECGETRKLARFSSCIQSTECDECGRQMKLIWSEKKKDG